MSVQTLHIPERRYAIFHSLLHGDYAIVIRKDDFARAPLWGNFACWLGAVKLAETRITNNKSKQPNSI